MHGSFPKVKVFLVHLWNKDCNICNGSILGSPNFHILTLDTSVENSGRLTDVEQISLQLQQQLRASHQYLSYTI